MVVAGADDTLFVDHDYGALDSEAGRKGAVADRDLAIDV